MAHQRGTVASSPIWQCIQLIVPILVMRPDQAARPLAKGASRPWRGAVAVSILRKTDGAGRRATLIVALARRAMGGGWGTAARTQA